jgi:hypothetical protein
VSNIIYSSAISTPEAIGAATREQDNSPLDNSPRTIAPQTIAPHKFVIIKRIIYLGQAMIKITFSYYL